MTDAEREAFYRARCAARRSFERMRCRVLMGDASLAAEVNADWDPILQFQRELRRYGYRTEDPCDRHDSCCPIFN